MTMSWYGGFPEYVSVAERRSQAEKRRKQLEKKGRKLDPVKIDGRAIASTPWGKAWCTHIEGCGDYESRLPRGRTYVRNGSVFDLQVRTGAVSALVSGSEVYEVEIAIAPLDRKRWKAIQRECAGKIGSVLELLTGKLSSEVMEVLCDRERGLFPAQKALTLSCSCPDGAWLCKHLAAVLYGIGARLDRSPELLFVLRGVDSSELVTAATSANVVKAHGAEIGADALSEIFGIELEAPVQEAQKPKTRHSRKVRPSATKPGAKVKRAAARSSPRA